MACIKKWQMAGNLPVRSAMQLMLLSMTVALTAACTHAFNWRDVAFDQAGVTALLPCKPDRGTRAVQLAGQTAKMSMAGCQAGGAMFTVALIEVSADASVNATAQDLKASGSATHTRQLQQGRFIAQASIYGQPNEGRDGPSALSSQAVDTFLTSLRMVATQ